SADKQLLKEHTFESYIAEDLWHYGNLNDYYMWMVATNELFRYSSRPENFHNYKWIKLGFGRLTKEQKNAVLNKVNIYSELEVTSSSRSNVEVNVKNVNKATGLKLICDRLGITFDNMVAIGDSLNDKSMIKAAQIGVAMDNAIPEIKEVSDYITDRSEEHTSELQSRFDLVYLNSFPTRRSSDLNVEVNVKNVNKATGLKLICDRLGITFDNMVAIGDSLNDKSMIKAAQIGVAMDNAIPEIKEVSDYITDSNKSDGVGKFIERLLNEM